MTETLTFNTAPTDRIIEMDWEDRNPFDAIKIQFGIGEQQSLSLCAEGMKS